MSDDAARSTLPLLPLQSTVVFPQRVSTVQVGAEQNVMLLAEHAEPDALVVLGFRRPGATGPTQLETLCEVAVVGRVLDRLKLPGNCQRITIQGLHRVRLVALTQEQPYHQAEIEDVSPQTGDAFKVNVQVQKCLNLYERLLGAERDHPKELQQILKTNVDDPGRFADLIGGSLELEYAERLQIIEAVDIDARVEAAVELLKAELDRVKVAQEVEKKAKGDIEESRREYYLRQQMRTIRKQLGDEDLSQKDSDGYAEQLQALGLDEAVSREAEREIERLRHIQPSSSEYQVIKTYLDRFFALPWGKENEEHIDLGRVRETLDAGHFGLSKVKERILEFLAVRKLNPGHKGPILCFAGPPGVGKTSLGQAIAEAIGRGFFRISVGGVRDEAEIRGHRRTYVGALPGKILNGLTRAGCMNPLLMLDEIDKIGSDHRGDPASALLEVLDPEQNNSFTDHYFNVPFDLSKVLFVCTANYLHDIPRPLLDRLEVISIEGYTENEKLQIGRRHLIPKTLKEHGLADEPPTFTDEGVLEVIRYWTREAGVRNLQRSLAKICRKVARERVEGGTSAPEIGPAAAPRYLGPQRFVHDEGVDADAVGAANGLAWTASGGEILVIEALKMKGHGKLVITGKLGEVMKESVQAAHSFTRSRSEMLGIGEAELEQYDIHIHFPAGAVPKDGPSAGVTVTLALASLLSGKAIRADVAMTGEVTLRGKVLPVGGIKDKLLAAYRAGIHTVVLPKANEKDLIEVPQEVRDATRFHLIEHVDELFDVALIGFKRALPPELPASADVDPTDAPTASG
ncbi:MAG: endopeptidase La [Myxococcales bacterium]|nr:endopeptidase La [Myxococcales bacterium]